jgi:16S rRNA (uracil1498-N3)-methyltransferase
MRLFYSQQKSDASFILEGDDHRHILKVLRYTLGDYLDIVDGSGMIYHGVIKSINKKEIRVDIESFELTNKIPYRLGIAISPVKNVSRFEWFVEKAVEIGITDIYPLLCKRTEKTNIKIDRVKRIIQSAMKQSRNVYEPVIHPKISINDMISLKGWESKYFAYINEDCTDLLSREKEMNPSILIAIGPEGGFEELEAEICIGNGFKPVSLGDSRLRTETAGVVSCQIIKTLQEIGQICTMETT